MLTILFRPSALSPALVAGKMIVRKDGQDDFLAGGEGLVEITSDRAAIATDMAVGAENIDEAKVEEARLRVKRRRRN